MYNRQLLEDLLHRVTPRQSGSAIIDVDFLGKGFYQIKFLEEEYVEIFFCVRQESGSEEVMIMCFTHLVSFFNPEEAIVAGSFF